jgi:ATP-binding cassette subfamily B protein
LGTFVRPYLGGLALVVLVSLAGTALALFQPYLSKLLIDRALLRHDMQALVLVAGLLFAATVLGFLFNILASYGT